MNFLHAINSGRVLLMDGALGTEFQRAGLPPGGGGEIWNLTQPGKVVDLHRNYRNAGAQVFLSNTFQSNPPVLARLGLAEQMAEINLTGIRLARGAAGRGRYILADVGPILDPSGKEFASRPALREVLSTLGEADGILFETCSSPAALTAVQYALHRVPEIEGLPLLLSLTYHRDHRGRLVTFSGHEPETYARHAAHHGVAALGVNCGRDISLDDVCEILQRYRAETDLPLLARPNAGTPQTVGEDWIYPLTPEEFAARLPDLINAGATLIGGCCGTTPEHIAALSRALSRLQNASH